MRSKTKWEVSVHVYFFFLCVFGCAFDWLTHTSDEIKKQRNKICMRSWWSFCMLWHYFIIRKKKNVFLLFSLSLHEKFNGNFNFYFLKFLILYWIFVIRLLCRRYEQYGDTYLTSKQIKLMIIESHSLSMYELEDWF